MHWQTKKVIRWTHLNAAGTLFGGKAMSWIDENSLIYAAELLNTSKLVTKRISELNFTSPGNNGDVVEIGVGFVRMGKSSIVVTCEIRNNSTKKTIVKVDELVFVHVDDNGRPTLHGALSK